LYPIKGGDYDRLLSSSCGHASVLWQGDPKGLNPKEITIAEVLKERG